MLQMKTQLYIYYTHVIISNIIGVLYNYARHTFIIH